ncbi:hypothetical protein Q7P37_003910 [Cladosporium fusiforme]
MYSCDGQGKLVYRPTGAESGSNGESSSVRPTSGSATATPPGAGSSNGTSTGSASCSETATTLHLSDPPYENYFLSDCHGANQVVVTSPLPDSNLTIIGPRLLIAWPAGNSGVVTFFAPQNGVNGSLGIELVNGTSDQPLSSYYEVDNPSLTSDDPRVGVTGRVRFNSSATLTVAILGSIRTIRDFTEGPSILVPGIQNATSLSLDDGVGFYARRWLDNVTTTYITFAPEAGDGGLSLDNGLLNFEAGTYEFNTSFDYPQLEQLSAMEVLNEESQGLIAQNPDQTQSLSFLSYSEKLLAGAWRFLTYFGRDSMIAYLLLEPVLSEGNSSATEAVISAVLERINRTDGSVCHEETIGDYATYLNQQDNITGTAPQYDYKMIDTDFFLPVVMKTYFIDSAVGRDRIGDFFSTEATIDPDNAGLTYEDLARISAEKIMNTTSAFAQPGGQTKDNLIHLKEGEVVGEWRDSTYGIGGGRNPYDVNAALVPAALRAIASLSAAGFFPEHADWNETASQHAQIWEDSTLSFFEVTVPQTEARSLVEDYTTTAGFGFPSHADNISSDVVYHGLALDGNNDQAIVKVMNTDDCFRHFLLNTTNQTQLTRFVSQTAANILQPFPVGLSTPVGAIVANPAYGGDEVYAANFTNNAYHGTVVWSWQLSMMAAGLERQLARCTLSSPPDFCTDATVHANVLAAYNHLWDLIEANADNLSSEVWSWVYSDGEFRFTPLGALPPPPGQSPTESNIRAIKCTLQSHCFRNA